MSALLSIVNLTPRRLFEVFMIGIAFDVVTFAICRVL